MNKNRVLKISLFLIAFILIAYPFVIKPYLLNTNSGNTIGIVIGQSFNPEGDPGIDFYYIVDDKKYSGYASDDKYIRTLKNGDTITVKYWKPFPNVASLLYP